MRILHVVHQYAPHFVGGTEIYTATLAAEQARRGHTVAVFTRVAMPRAHDAPELQRTDGDLTLYRWWQPPSKGIYHFFLDSYAADGATRQFAEVLRDFRPELVHIQHLKGLHYQLPAVAAEAGLRVVLTLHDYWYFCANAQLIRPKGYVCGGPRWWLNCADCAAHRAHSPLMLAGAPVVAGLMARRSHALATALSSASVVIAPSIAVAEYYRSHTNIGAKLRVIEHGIEPIAPGLGDPRRDGGPLRVLFAGGLAWQKGVHILIEAFAKLAPGLARLDICGDDTTFPDYAAQLKQLARGHDITFHGGLPHAQVIDMMRAADVLAIPSLWPETASLVALEAQSVGLPLIASDVGALRERVRNAADGWLVRPGDVAAWTAALRTAAATKAAGRALTIAPPSLTLANHVDQISAVYAELVPA